MNENHPPPDQRGVRWWIPLLVSMVAVGFALVVAGLICGPLSSIVSPPMPPIYAGATLLGAQNEDYGVDSWQYRTDDDVCQVFEFYRREALRCAPMSAAFCEAPRTPPPNASSRYASQCSGRGEAWPFHWVWQVILRETYTPDGPHTEFDLTRTVYWGTGSD